jgi:hypothetical protein
MKNIERIIKRILKEESESHSSRYMFFSNLEKMKRQCEMLLDIDESEIESILENGHDWAQDHISEAKNNMDQVFDFLMNETKGSDDYDDDMIEEDSSEEDDESLAISLKNPDLGLAMSDMTEGRKKTGTKLCSRGKSAAKSKFDVYPSAYANGYAVQVCKGTKPGLDGKKRCSPPYC